MENRKAAAYRQGVIIFILLAILTVLEFFVSSIFDGSIVLLFIMALLKAGIIVHYFMHIYRLWRTEEEH